MALNWEAIRTGLIALRMSIGLTQKGLADACGVGEKTLSSYESGKRLKSLKLWQLEAIVVACGSTLADFFAAIAQTREVEDAEMSDDDLDALVEAIAGGGGSFSSYPTPQSSLSPHARNVIHIGRRHSS
ncbi:MAG TPA: helix-turn-helix transcriptional regulator [Gemmatimonadaceae bacterium]